MSKTISAFPSLVCAALLASSGTAALAAESARKPAAADTADTAELERKLAAARQRLDEAAREVADLSMSLSDDLVPHIREFGAMGSGQSRAMLGINLGVRSGSQEEGVEVISVSPGGAAQEAGLKAGDVLTDVNGVALKRDKEGSAREKLRKAMRKVKPGEKVAVSYRRDGKVLKASLAARPLEDHFFTFAVPDPDLGSLAHLRRFAFRRVDGILGSAELVALTPKLGKYFGTEAGLLVVRAPDDDRIKLEEGDVIVDIDGRAPSSPAHALRILSSYQPGEKLKLNVLRAQQPVSFDITVPDEPRHKDFDGARLERGILYAPMPAMPAIPPLQPAPGADAFPIVEPLPEEPV